MENLNLTPLQTAIREEEQRRRTSIAELIELSNIVINAIRAKEIDHSTIKESTIDGLRFDIDIMNSLMNYLNAFHEKEMSFALKTNKITVICEGAIDFIESRGIDKLIAYNINEYLKLDPEKPTYFFDSENDFGTGKPTFVAVALLRILSVLEDAPHFSDLKLVLGHVYDIETSPVIQTVKFPDNFDSSAVLELENCFFYYLYADNNIGELLVPTGGYFYGGSREDKRFWNKQFRTEDCSSAVAKWCDLPTEISTAVMKMALLGSFEGKEELLCRAILEKLRPRNDNTPPEIGDVYLIRHSKGGHTGMVTAITGEGFEGLSYNRELPERDGLAYQNYVREEEKEYYFFQYIYNLLEEGMGTAI